MFLCVCLDIIIIYLEAFIKRHESRVKKNLLKTANKINMYLYDSLRV